MAEKTCPGCKDTFITKDKRKVYCSHSCAATAINRSRKINGLEPNKCLRCEKVVRARTRFYCSKECRQLHEEERWIAGKLDGNGKYAPKEFVRRVISKRSGDRCEGIDSRTNLRCTEDRVVQLDHIDGDWTNTTYANMQHLCPTCHTLTETWGHRNVGRGRAWKKNYSQYELKV